MRALGLKLKLNLLSLLVVLKLREIIFATAINHKTTTFNNKHEILICARIT